MLTRFDPLFIICKQIFNARCYHRMEPPMKANKASPISKKIKNAAKLKDLHYAMERLERRQKKLNTEMDEADKMLDDILQKDKKDDVNSTKKKT